MSDGKKNSGVHLGQGGVDADKRVAALLREIQQEMDAMTPEELERLYAVVALMADAQGK